MAEIIDYVVIGNGLIGAAAAHYLAERGDSVCVIGAPYGFGGSVFSSHEDTTRIYRSWHDDDYWRALAGANHTAIRRLEAATGMAVLDAAPVYYDHYHAAYVPTEGNGSFAYEDRLGGAIDPKRYIAALNQAAQRQGAHIHSGVVHDVSPVAGRFEIGWNGGALQCRKVIDARGIHSFRSERLKVQAKVVMQVEHAPSGHRHCFVKRHTGVPVFADFYACAEFGNTEPLALSKFGVSESKPLWLDSADDVRDWFTHAYLNYPHLSQLIELVRGVGLADIASMTLRPCAFTVTEDGMPLVTERANYLGLSGCNGMAAKCCQALVQALIGERGF